MIPPAKAMNRGHKRTELERQHGARNGADREEDRRAVGPASGEIESGFIPGPEVQTFGQRHQEGHTDPDRREDDVEGERHRHL